jgi:GTPase
MMTSNQSSNSQLPSSSEPQQLHCGYVALVGRPNAGKSTLFNSLLGQRLSIVTPKPQTTRDRILGVLTRDDSQLIFLDTPGLLEPQYKLHESMGRQIETAARQADVVLLLIDATQPRDRFQLVKSFVESNQFPMVPLLNKIDQVDKGLIDGIMGTLCKELGIPSMLPISALRGDNLDLLLARMVTLVPKGPQLYPDDMVADQPERFFVAELIREAAFNNLDDELPYALSVTIDEFREDAAKTYIGATIHVERTSQKGIVIGKKGVRLRAIGSQARKEVEALLDVSVYLDLWVKVRPDWRRKERDLKEFGYA